MIDTDTELLKGIANQLRIHSIEATTAAGSGHPTSCCSAADIVATLFFGQMRYDAKNPHFYNNDRFILSKGHAAPLLYAAWAENGFVPIPELLTLRQFSSELEGHPTPRLAFADVADRFAWPRSRCRCRHCASGASRQFGLQHLRPDG